MNKVLISVSAILAFILLTRGRLESLAVQAGNIGKSSTAEAGAFGNSTGSSEPTVKLISATNPKFQTYIELKRRPLRGQRTVRVMRRLLSSLDAVHEAMAALRQDADNEQRMAAVEFLGDSISANGNPSQASVIKDIEAFVLAPTANREQMADKIELFAKIARLNSARARALIAQNAQNQNANLMKYALYFQTKHKI